jgi:hypothetical protein
LGLNFGDFGANNIGTVVATGKLDMEPSREDGVPSLLEVITISTIPYNIAHIFIPCAHKPRSSFLAPPFFIPHILRVMNLSTAFALVTYNNDTDTTAIEVTRCERTNAAGASNAEVNGMSSCVSGKFVAAV